MFETLPNPSPEMLFMIGRAVMLVGAFWIFALAFTRWRRADARSAAALEARLEQTFAEVRGLHETVAVMKGRLEAMSEQNDTDARRAPAGAYSSQRGYDVAARLARSGSDVGELMTSCGVTRHEAELLVRLHGGRNREEAVAQRHVRSAQEGHVRPAQEERHANTEAPAPNTGRKRGGLLSVVG